MTEAMEDADFIGEKGPNPRALEQRKPGHLTGPSTRAFVINTSSATTVARMFQNVSFIITSTVRATQEQSIKPTASSVLLVN